jgi:NAD(P)H-hydrate epimerase
VVHHGDALARESGDVSLAEAVASGQFDGLDRRVSSLCVYAVRLTRDPGAVCEDDLDILRAAGLDDRAIVDANQVVSYFNYVNRIALGLGVELEPTWPGESLEPRRYQLSGRASPLPCVDAGALPWVSVEHMRKIDRVMTETLGITLERMMENAGRSLAQLARQMVGGDAVGCFVRVLAGPGANGGGGLVAARHLAAAGAEVDVWMGVPAGRLRGVSSAQHQILRRMDVRVEFGRTDEDERKPDLVVDALLGYGHSGAPRGEVAELIAWSAGRRVLSLDVPSGLELETGILHSPHVRAEATLTVAAPKTALIHNRQVVGELFVADISVPPSVYKNLGVDHASPFGRGSIVRVRFADALGG